LKINLDTFKSLGISSVYSPTSSSSSGYLGNKEFSTISTSDHPKLPSRQFPSQPQHFIDAFITTTTSSTIITTSSTAGINGS
jgi:hypothetical protein